MSVVKTIKGHDVLVDTTNVYIQNASQGKKVSMAANETKLVSFSKPERQEINKQLKGNLTGTNAWSVLHANL